MEAHEQIELVREFMLALAPIITRHTLNAVEKKIDSEFLGAARNLAETPNDDHIKYLRDAAAQEGAYSTLRWAMHLAAQFAQCQDTINEKNSVTTTLRAESIQHEATGAAG